MTNTRGRDFTHWNCCVPQKSVSCLTEISWCRGLGHLYVFKSFSNLLSCTGMVWRIHWMILASYSSSWTSSPPSAGASMRRPALCSCSSLTSQPSPTRSCCRAPPPAPWMLLCKKVSTFGKQRPASLRWVVPVLQNTVPEACVPGEHLTVGSQTSQVFPWGGACMVLNVPGCGQTLPTHTALLAEGIAVLQLTAQLLGEIT